MRTKKWLLMLLLVITGLNFNSAETNADVNIGLPFMGIQAKSNGADTETGNGYYQCVELVKRFATEYYQSVDVQVYCAANMWNVLPTNFGYTAIENDSTDVQPQVGDFIIWWTTGWQSCSDSSGHVAIVSRVMQNQIEVIEQNIRNTTAPYRLLPMSKENGKWHLEPGERLGSYYVKGWLRYPGFSVIGRSADGQTFNQRIKDCYDRENDYRSDPDMGKMGWPIDDGGGVFVHNWLPYSYVCQNFRNAQGQESVIMYGAPFTGEAYLISGAVWEYYRYGYNGHYGPDIVLPDGKRLGAPTSVEINGCQLFENGYYVKKINAAISLKSLAAKSESVSHATVELHQLDGTLVETYGPTGELSALTLSGKPVSSQQIILVWLGGPVGDYFQVLDNGVQAGITALAEFTQTGMTPGSTHCYQVVTMSNDSGELAYSNEVTVVLPGQQGTFTLQATPRPNSGGNLVDLDWQNTLYLTQFYWIYRDGVMIGNMAGNPGQTELGYSDWPVEPNDTYTYQVMATNLSGTQLGFSNEILVTTPEADPIVLPDLGTPFPTLIDLNLSQTLWVWGQSTADTSVYVSARVFDQYGGLMPEERLLLMSADPQIFSVGYDSGWCIATGIGTTRVWAQDYNWSGIRSPEIIVTVVDELPPDPILPDIYESADLQLDEFVLLSNEPFVQYSDIYYAVTLSNPTDYPIAFYGPQLYHFNLNGVMVADSPYMSSPWTLQPGEIKRFAGDGGQVQAAGDYYCMVMVSYTGQYVAPRDVIDQTAPDVNNKIYIHSISPNDLKPDLQAFDLYLGSSELRAGDDVCLNSRIFNLGQAAATVPFSVSIGIRGFDFQVCQFSELALNGYGYCNLFFPGLPVGNYIADFVVDPDNLVVETNKANNVMHLPFQVMPNYQPPQILVSPINQSALTGSTVVFSVSAAIAAVNDLSDLPLSYQWQKDGANLLGANSQDLTLTKVGFDQAGSYACVVTTANNLSAVSDIAVLTIWPKLAISQQPLVLTLTEGESLSNCVVVQGVGELKYQWYKDGQPIVSAIESCLQISAVSLSDAGFYFCRITDSLEPTPQKINSKTVQLAIRPAGLDTPELRLYYADGDDKITAELFANQWALAGLLVNPYALPAKKVYADITAVGLRFNLKVAPKVCFCDGDLIQVNPNGQSSPLSLFDGQGYDTANQAISFAINRTLNCSIMPYLLISGKRYYLILNSVKVTLNGQGLDWLNGKIPLYLAKVKPQLSVTTQPQSQTVKTGATVRFDVFAVGDPVVTYQWLKNGLEIEGATRSYLRLIGVSLSDAGEYACLVKTTAGVEVLSDQACLTVYQKLLILESPISQTAILGNSCQFAVEAIGEGSLNYQWRKDGKNIIGATQNLLVISAVQHTDAGSYTCLVTDSCPGTIQRRLSPVATLTVNLPLVVSVCATKISSDVLADCPEVVRLNPRQSVEFTCTSSGGIPPYTFQWFFNDQPLELACEDKLIKNEVQDCDEGNYTCRVTDSEV